MSEADVAVATVEPLPPTPSAARRLGGIFFVAILVAAAWFALQFVGLEQPPFHTKGEPREAVVVQDLVRSGNWILPKRNGVDLPRKPPLFYWLGGLSSRISGVVDEASVRRPSAVLSGIACVAIAAMAAAFYGPVAGIMSGLMLMTSFEWIRAAVTARVDMTLSFGLTLAFAGMLLFRRDGRGIWLLLLYAGAAWATLSKGIPGLAIPVLQVILLCLFDRSPSFARRIRPLLGIAAVLLVVGAWYAAAAAQGGREFVDIVIKENFVRVVGDDDFDLGHENSIGYLFGALAAGLLPWTILLPSVGASLWQARRQIDRLDPRWFALLWTVAVFAPYAVATSKRGVYLLPLYPAVALLTGWWAAELVRGRIAARWLSPLLAAVGWILALLFGLLAVMAAAQAVGLPWLGSIATLLDPRAAYDVSRVAAALHGPYLPLAFAAATLAALAIAIGAGLRQWPLALAGLLICVASMVVGVRAAILPAVGGGYTREPFSRALRLAAIDPDAIHADGLDYGTLFYWQQPMPAFDRRQGGEPPPYLLLPEPDWLRMSAAERAHYRRVPGLRIAQSNNQGYVVLLERAAPPAP